MPDLLKLVGELGPERIAGCVNCEQTIFFNGQSWRNSNDNGRCPQPHDLVIAVVFIPRTCFGRQLSDKEVRLHYCLRCSKYCKVGEFWYDDDFPVTCFDDGHMPPWEAEE